MKKKASAVTLLALASLVLSVACAGGAAPSQPTAPAAGPAAPKTAASPAASPAAAPKTGASPAAAPKTGASPAASPAAAPKAAPSGPLKEVKAGWTPSFAFIPLAVAEDIGEFQQEGLKVTIIDFQGGAEVTSAMLGRSIDIAATAMERPMILFEQGQMAKNIMHTQSTQAYGIVVRSDLNVSPGDWAALRGKKLGVTRPGSGTDVTLRALLKLNNLEPDRDVQVIGVSGIAQGIAALEAKQVDGLIQTEPGLTQITEVQNLGEMFLDLRKEGPESVRNAAFLGLQANADYIEQNPEIVKSVIRAVARTQKRIRQDPGIALPTLKRYFANIGDATLLKIAQNEAPTFHAAITRQQMRNLNELLKTAGILKSDVPYDQVVVGPEFQELWQLSE